jgi:hypothetical protein
MYRRIILPQLVLRAARAGNQLISPGYRLPLDHLVRELTAPRARCSQYFIPFEAFVVAIGAFGVSLLIEALVARTGFAAERKGLIPAIPARCCPVELCNVSDFAGISAARHLPERGARQTVSCSARRFRQSTLLRCINWLEEPTA